MKWQIGSQRLRGLYLCDYHNVMLKISSQGSMSDDTLGVVRISKVATKFGNFSRLIVESASELSSKATVITFVLLGVIIISSV